MVAIISGKDLIESINCDSLMLLFFDRYNRFMNLSNVLRDACSVTKILSMATASASKSFKIATLFCSMRCSIILCSLIFSAKKPSVTAAKSIINSVIYSFQFLGLCEWWCTSILIFIRRSRHCYMIRF